MEPVWLFGAGAGAGGSTGLTMGPLTLNTPSLHLIS